MSEDLAIRPVLPATVGEDRLADLSKRADEANTTQEARQVMVEGKTLADLLIQVRAPYEESWLAGKASVVAARRLGTMLAQVPSKPLRPTGQHGGAEPGRRAALAVELGMGKSLLRDVLRLAQVSDPDFQRFIQDKSRIPSLNGALRKLTPEPRDLRTYGPSRWAAVRRKKVGVKVPANPSLDEAHSLVVRALGHLAGGPAHRHGGGNERGRAIARAIDLLYKVEDELRPLTGGYVK